MELPLKVDLSGKVAVVTGGGGVLCSAMAKAMALSGAKIAILNRSKESSDKVAAEINAAGGEAIGVSADVLNKESLIAAEEIIREKLGACDILINGAGGNHPKGTTSKEYCEKEDLVNGAADLVSFYELETDGVSHVFNLNFIGSLLATQVFTKNMALNSGGTVINISSMSAFSPLTKIPAYSAAKSAVDNFTQWLAVHMSKVGIRVNAIAPGFFLSEQNRSLLTNEDGSYTARAEKIISQTPMGRFGNADELLGTLLWLVDDKSSGFVNGIVVPVDGGFSAFSGV